MAERKVLVINPKDNVAIALRHLQAGEVVGLDDGHPPIQVREAIAASHKLAITDIPGGQPVIKYGELIALAARDIQRGEWVHVHNLDADAPVTSYAEYFAALTRDRG